MSAEFLPALADVRNLDHLERRLVQAALEILVPLEIAVRLFDDDVPLEQQAFEHVAHVELGVVRVARAEDDVFQVEIDGDGGIGVG